MHGDKEASLQRFRKHYKELSDGVKARCVSPFIFAGRGDPAWTDSYFATVWSSRTTSSPTTSMTCFRSAKNSTSPSSSVSRPVLRFRALESPSTETRTFRLSPPQHLPHREADRGAHAEDPCDLGWEGDSTQVPPLRAEERRGDSHGESGKFALTSSGMTLTHIHTCRNAARTRTGVSGYRLPSRMT